MHYVLASPFQQAITELLAEKHALGFRSTTSFYRLAEFDRFCCEEFPQETMLSQAIAERWAELRPQEHPNTRGQRIFYVRQLAQYMIRMGLHAYVLPPGIEGRRIQYQPHVFTMHELRAFFTAVDHCRPTPWSPTRHLVVPVLFRLFYCCGMRPAEVAHLHVEDVDWSAGQIFVRQSKGYKDRIVPLATDLLALCQDYETHIRKLVPARTGFFPNRAGHPFDSATFDDWFHQFWDQAALPHVSGNAPRLYDLRHTFCVHRLNRWVREGRDIHGLLPYLSRYLGHTSLSSTDYYLHLVPDFFPDWRAHSQRGETLLPEVLK